jgi:hypothetical protein
MIFTEDLLEIVGKTDPYILFLPDTYDHTNKQERICFYDSLLREKFTLCFDYRYSKLNVFISHSNDYPTNINLRIRQLEQKIIPILIPIIKDHPLFRIKFSLNSCSIENHLSDKKLHYYSLNELLEIELYEFPELGRYFSRLLTIFILYSIGLGALYLLFTYFKSNALSSIFFYFSLLFIVLVSIFLYFLICYYRSFFTAIKEYFLMKKIKKLERKKIK